MLKDAIASLEAIDLKADWRSVKSRLIEESAPKRLVPVFSKLARYAAIFLLPLGAAFIIYFIIAWVTL